MDGGARAKLETRIRRLETAVSALLSEYSTARARLHDLEDAADEGTVEGVEPGPVADAMAVTATDEATATPDREATQAEVERAVRRAESDDGEEAPASETARRESDVIEPSVR